ERTEREEGLDQANEDRELADLHDQDVSHESPLVQISHAGREAGGDRKRDRAEREWLGAAERTGRGRGRDDRDAGPAGVRLRQAPEGASRGAPQRPWADSGAPSGAASGRPARSTRSAPAPARAGMTIRRVTACSPATADNPRPEVKPT